MISLWIRRARLLWAAGLIMLGHAAKDHGEAILADLERQLGLAPAKPFRWSDYRPHDQGEQ